MSLERTCRYGHGALVRDPGWWSLQGVEFVAKRSKKEQAPGVEAMDDENVSDIPQAYVLRLWRCPTCGYVELFDNME